MTNDDKIRDVKLRYNSNREAAKKPKKTVLSPDKIYKYEFLTGEEILEFDQNRIIE